MTATRENAAIIEQLLAIKPVVEGEFNKCPGCKQPIPFANGAMPPSSLWLIEDENLPAKWVVLNGWICENSVYGTVVLRGPVAGEKEPVFSTKNSHSIHGYSYVKNLSGRTVRDY